MNGETLFEHIIPDPEKPEEHEGQTVTKEDTQEDNQKDVQATRCETLQPECGCTTEDTDAHRGESVSECAFSTWVAAVACGLTEDLPKDTDLPSSATTRDLHPDGPLDLLLSLKVLGPHYESKTLAFPGFYAFHDRPADQGVRLLGTLYSKAIDPRGDLGIDHRAGYRREPGECIVGRYFAAGFVEHGENEAELAYCANHIDLRKLVCRTQEELEVLYQKVLQAKLPG